MRQWPFELALAVIFAALALAGFVLGASVALADRELCIEKTGLPCGALR